MAYRLEDRDIIIDGFENGIADSPYSGIADMRGLNIVSIPGEASVNFATTSIASPSISGTVVSANDGTDVITVSGVTGVLENRICIKFTGASLPTGITANTPYWIGNLSSSTFKIYSHPSEDAGDLVNITATGTGTFASYDMGEPKHFTYDFVNNNYWMIDSLGQVWFNGYTTDATGAWVFTGNTGGTGLQNGNGIVFYYGTDATTPANNVPYILVFRNSRIDYTVATNSTFSWVYGWNPVDGSANNNTDMLNTPNGTNNTHFVFVAPFDDRIYYCDGSYIGSIYQKALSGAPFNPTVPTSFTWNKRALLIPQSATALCLGYFSNKLLIGGNLYAVYTWDGIVTSYNSIYISERGIYRIETVNTNAYLFAGNRGRIYLTNGTQAQLVKKIPDHLSDTVEPYFIWGGSCIIKNQIYFGLSAMTNAGVNIPNYGGLWAFDVDTESIRITNQLSYGTYAGGAKAMIPVATSSPTGVGIYIGWSNGSTYGIDTTSSSPYTGYTAYFESDMLPIGTYLQKRTFEWLEFKLNRAMVSGEGIKLSYRTSNTGTYTLINETLYSSTADTNMSDAYNVNFENTQWIQIRADVKSTATNPSFVRLRELRIR